jgi:hypothetical protein
MRRVHSFGVPIDVAATPGMHGSWVILSFYRSHSLAHSLSLTLSRSPSFRNSLAPLSQPLRRIQSPTYPSFFPLEGGSESRVVGAVRAGLAGSRPGAKVTLVDLGAWRCAGVVTSRLDGVLRWQCGALNAAGPLSVFGVSSTSVETVTVTSDSCTVVRFSKVRKRCASCRSDSVDDFLALC